MNHEHGRSFEDPELETPALDISASLFTSPVKYPVLQTKPRGNTGWLGSWKIARNLSNQTIAKLRDQHIKSTKHCENTKGNIWKNTNGKKSKTKQDLSDTSCSNSEVFQGWPTATEQNCAWMVSKQSRAKPADKNACTVHLLQTSNTFNHMLIFNVKKCINKRDDGNHQKTSKQTGSCFLLF